jgi:3-hydroxyacyl-CoA dehydrogenase
VIGAGTIGVGWAIVFARAGHVVTVHDIDRDRLEAVGPAIRQRLTDMDRFNLLDAGESVREVSERVTVTDRLAAAVAHADHVQECVAESLPVKRELFGELDQMCRPRVVLASSSSMITCSRIAEDLVGRERCLIVHPGNPPYLLPVAEIVPAPFSSVDAVERTVDLMRSAGMAPVRLTREVEGFVFNRLQGALLREAYCLVRDGVASVADIDAVVRLGLGRRWGVLGPFATSDLNTRGGIERHAQVMGPAYARMGLERGQNDPWTPELVARVAAELHEYQPLSDWSDNVVRRDRALMRLLTASRSGERRNG